MRHILDLIKSNQPKNVSDMLDKHIAQNPEPPKNENVPNYVRAPEIAEMTVEDLDGRTPEEIKKEENIDTDDMYSIKNFSI